MAKLRWDSHTRRRRDGRLVRIRFEHHYFPTLAGGKPRMSACVSADEQAIMKKQRLI